MTTLSAEQVRWFRLRRSGLVEPFATPEAAASALVGIQAQILPAAAVSLWNRTAGLTYDIFDRRLHQERTLVKLWGQRGTLHLYPSREWPLIQAAIAYQRTWWDRKAEQFGTTVEAYRATIAQVAELLRQKQTMGRSDLGAADVELDETFFSSWGGIFRDLVHHGHACHAGQAGNEGLFAHREHWLPELEWNPPPAEAANVELARRYFHAYGPATLHDFSYWRYARVSDARRWLAELSDCLVEVEVQGRPMLALDKDVDTLSEAAPPHDAWPIRLLYRFDPLLLGHKDKSWLIDVDFYKRVWRPAGHIEGVVLDHGRIAGTWRYDRKGSGLVVTVFPFSEFRQAARAAVAEHAAGVAGFFGLPLANLILDS